MINKIYSTLMRGQEASGPYARIVDRSVRYDARGALFVPADADVTYKAYCADQLACLCARSPLTAEMMACDPINTYSFEISPITVSTILGGFAEHRLVLQESSLFKEWIYRQYTGVLNPGGQLVINNRLFTFNWSGNLSDIIDLGDGMAFRFSGEAPTLPVNFTIDATRPARRDIAQLFNTLKQTNMPVSSEFASLISDRDINIALPAMVINYVNSVNN